MRETSEELWRVHLRLTKKEVERRSGLSRKTVYDSLKSGARSRETQEALAKAFDITTSELLSGPPGYDTVRGGPDLDVAEPTRVYNARATSFSMVPIFEDIMPGGFSSSTQSGEYPVLNALLSHNEMVTVVVSDDEVTNYHTGDILLVDPSTKSAQSGDLVIASVDGGVSRLYRAMLHHGEFVLVRDAARSPMIREGWVIHGIVVDLVHRERKRL